MGVSWTEPARDDLDDLRQHISRDSAFYAQAFVERILAATRQLRDFPLSGRRVPEVDDEAIREIIVRGYRVIYRVEASVVLVLAVMHGSRDLTKAGTQPWEVG
jgi:addiction module RelE/StbE family toxin